MRHHGVGLELDTSCGRTAVLRWGRRLREPKEGQAEMGRRAESGSWRRGGDRDSGEPLPHWVEGEGTHLRVGCWGSPLIFSRGQ